MTRLISKNIWNSETKKFESGVIEIQSGRISSLEFGSAKGTQAKKAGIDLGELHIGPSAIDLHIHSRDFEESHKETFESLELAAIRGGVSVMACMANTRPRLDNVSQVKEFLKRAEKLKVLCLPFAAVTENLEGQKVTDWNALLRLPTAGLSDDGRPIENADIMKAALMATKKAGKILSLHEEDHSHSKASKVHLSETSMRLGLEGSPSTSESLMVERDLKLAELTKAPVHFGHISSKVSVELIRKAKRKGIQVSAELTPHHALLTVDEIEKISMTERSLYKVCPVIRSSEDRSALLKAAADGSLDCFASDHAPHSVFEKALPYDQAFHGIISLEHHFALYNEVRLRAEMTWARYFEATSVRPAALLKLKDQGAIRKGAKANLIVFDPNSKQHLNWSASKSSNTPLKNFELRGRLHQHWIEGKKVYES